MEDFKKPDPENDSTEQTEQDNASSTPESSTEQEDCRKQLEETKKELLYLHAEFDNFRKRILREQETNVRFANEKLIKELLSVVDLFERALSHAEKLKSPGSNEALNTLLTGIEMTHKQLVQILSRSGAELIGAVGEEFDPNRHEAVSHAEGDQQLANKVTEVVQRGCLLQGRLLVPARVVVGK